MEANSCVWLSPLVFLLHIHSFFFHTSGESSWEMMFCFYNDDTPGFSLWKQCWVIREMEFYPQRGRNLSSLWEGRIWKATEVNCHWTGNNSGPLLWCCVLSSAWKTAGRTTKVLRQSELEWRSKPIWTEGIVLWPEFGSVSVSGVRLRCGAERIQGIFAKTVWKSSRWKEVSSFFCF